MNDNFSEQQPTNSEWFRSRIEMYQRYLNLLNENTDRTPMAGTTGLIDPPQVYTPEIEQPPKPDDSYEFLIPEFFAIDDSQESPEGEL